MKYLLTLVLLFVSSVSIAAGTNVSSGFSTTTGTAYTAISQHGNYNSQGNGVSLAYSSDADGSNFRGEVYSVEVETNTQGYGFVSDTFMSTSHSNSAGMLSTSEGMTAGTSNMHMVTESHTDTYGGGLYMEVAQSNSGGSGAWNYESGSFSFHDHTLAETNANSETLYSANYSNSSFNY